jgi:hypothetical protein
MTNALTILTPQTWQMIESIAPAMHACRLFGVSSKEQAAAIMLKGYELGLGLTASFEFIHVVQGKPTLSPRGALALILQHPELAELNVDDKKDACQVTMKRKNGFSYTVEFTLEDAKKAGVVKSGSGWESYPKNMLRWRAIGFCADVVFPDVIGGMKRSDEMGAAITPEGDVIEGQWQAYTEQPKANLLESLVAQYGVDAILAANDGKIPASDEELTTVAIKLESEGSNGG